MLIEYPVGRKGWALWELRWEKEGRAACVRKCSAESRHSFRIPCSVTTHPCCWLPVWASAIKLCFFKNVGLKYVESLRVCEYVLQCFWKSFLQHPLDPENQSAQNFKGMCDSMLFWKSCLLHHNDSSCSGEGKCVKICPENCKLTFYLPFHYNASWLFYFFFLGDCFCCLSCIKKHASERAIRANAVLKSERPRYWRSFCIEISGSKCSPVKIISMMSKSDLYSREHNCIVMAHYLTFYKPSFNTANEYFCVCMLTARMLLGNNWHLETKQNIKYTVCLLFRKDPY